jgi:LytS/YehU family sensor histidine kinase
VKAELKNLKNQINPHFLFNSLNSLFALVEEQPELARKFIIKLSKVYRYLLDSSNSNLIALQQELDFIRHYLFLQKIRFGESLDMDIDIRPDLLRKKLPSASLQSLVENAIKHNRITENNPLLIKIFSNDLDQLVVENNYQPRTELVHSPGTGLKNLSALYQHLGCNSLSYGFDNGKYRVQLPLL